MDSTKQLKVAKMVQKELGEIFQRENYALASRSLITVTQVRTTPDLGIAMVFLSIFGGKEPRKVFSEIAAKNYEIRKKLGGRIRHRVRIIPELKFFFDDSQEYAEKIDKLLKEAKK
jgi:ribosome-binding factor A